MCPWWDIWAAVYSVLRDFHSFWDKDISFLQGDFFFPSQPLLTFLIHHITVTALLWTTLHF